jgi:general secretion pathway protein E/type IV pilus assembly protein PilB
MELGQELKIETEQIQRISREQAWHYQIVPWDVLGAEMIFYSAVREDWEDTESELEILFGCSVRLKEVESEFLKRALIQYYPQDNKNAFNAGAQSISGAYEDFLPKVIDEAKGIGASDIHIEVYEELARVRFRIDGKLVERYRLSHEEYPALVNKIKIQANLDIAEKRLPQDGRIFFKGRGGDFDIRVSSLPTLNGEKMVLRLLSKDASNICLEQMGFSEEQMQTYLQSVKRPNGIVLISGPTGSGKTTTLYATLKLLNREETNILTVEDPIEYTLEGINQVQLKESIGLTFASALRTFLRQDPDIIMLGEIRDMETAQMAIRAALTGHLVFSTIHTNSAWGTLSRLLDMGIPPYLLAGTLNLSMAQRLVRLLCPHCKKKEPVGPGLFPPGFSPQASFQEHAVAVGCEHCYYTGYSGRKAIYELIPVDAEIAAFIKENRLNLEEILAQRKLTLLKDAAWELLTSYQTSVEEVYAYFI